jgi:hypothetical protein
MTDELILDHDDMRLLHRHYINLTCVDSGMSAIKQNGGKPKRYHKFPAYPISVDLERDVIFFDEDGLDYGAYLLDPMALMALSQNGIVPIEEAQWNADDLPDFPFWTLVGLPTQFATLRHDGPSKKSHVTVHVTGLHDRPAGLNDKKHQRLFAHVEFQSVAEWGRDFDIGGMSGGPIFGTRVPPQGDSYDYRLIGIQSCWNEQEHVAICPALSSRVGGVGEIDESQPWGVCRLGIVRQYQ